MKLARRRVRHCCSSIHPLSPKRRISAKSFAGNFSRSDHHRTPKDVHLLIVRPLSWLYLASFHSEEHGQTLSQRGKGTLHPPSPSSVPV